MATDSTISILIDAKDLASAKIQATAKKISDSTDKVKTSIDKNTSAAAENVNASDRMGSSWAKMGAIAGAVGGVVNNVVNRALNEMTGLVDNAVSRVDTLNNFPRIMENFGVSASDATKMINQLDQGVRGLPTTLNDIVQLSEGFVPLTKNTDLAAKTALALNNAILAGGAPMQVQTAALEQFRQALSKGVPDLQDWKTIEMAMPAQLQQVTEKLGIGKGALQGYTQNGLGLYKAMKDGKLSMNDFNNALIELNNTGINGLPNFATQAKNATQGIATGFTNAKTAITRGIADIIQAIGSKNISTAVATLGSGLESAMKAGAQGVVVLKAEAKQLWQTITSNLGPGFQDLFATIKHDVIPSLGSLSENYVKPIAKVLGGVLLVAVKQVTNALTFVASTSRTLIPVLLGVGAGLAALKFGNMVLDVIAFARALDVSALAMKGFAAATAILELNPIVLAASALVGLFTTLIALQGPFASTSDASKAAVDRHKLAEDDLTRAMKGVKQAQDDLIHANLDQEGASLRVEQAQKVMQDAIKNFGPNSLEARQAVHDYKEAQQDLADATNRVKDATQAVKDKQDEVIAKKKAVQDALNDMKNSANDSAGGFRNLANTMDMVKNKQNSFASGKPAPLSLGAGGIKLPGHALGTNFAPGGPTQLAESGWELVKQPGVYNVAPGSKVLNARDTQAALSGTGGNVNVVQNIYNQLDYDRGIKELGFLLRRKAA